MGFGVQMAVAAVYEPADLDVLNHPLLNVLYYAVSDFMAMSRFHVSGLRFQVLGCTFG